jgi:hypothetical protein
MSEETTTDTDYRTEVPVESETPGNDASMTTEAMAGLQEVNINPEATDIQKQLAHERAMFERYVQEQGEKIPGNFKSAGEWFDSLKNAQGQYTQGQQEIAELKKQYEMSGNTNNPDYVEPTSATEAMVSGTPEVASSEDLLNELRIPDPENKNQETEVTSNARVSEADYTKWSSEIASTGALSQESREELKIKTGFTDAMVNDYLTAHQAKRRQAFAEASELVGGGDKLSKILRWAANNFDGDKLASLQSGLASPNSELTLRGLAAAYEQANPNKEPARPTNAVTPQQAGASRELPGYKSMAEYRMDMSNPRFARDDKFRNAVEMRAARTDWRKLQ